MLNILTIHLDKFISDFKLHAHVGSDLQSVLRLTDTKRSRVVAEEVSSHVYV